MKMFRVKSPFRKSTALEAMAAYKAAEKRLADAVRRRCSQDIHRAQLRMKDATGGKITPHALRPDIYRPGMRRAAQ